MNRLHLIKKYARVWKFPEIPVFGNSRVWICPCLEIYYKAPWLERLKWRQQEMRYMWNSQHPFDGGAFYRQMGRFTGKI